MAVIKVNGVTRSSGAGFHARKGLPGRRRTRAALLDAAVSEQVGIAFRTGASAFTAQETDAASDIDFDADDPYEKYADFDV